MSALPETYRRAYYKTNIYCEDIMNLNIFKLFNDWRIKRNKQLLQKAIDDFKVKHPDIANEVDKPKEETDMTKILEKKMKDEGHLDIRY